MRSSAAEGAVRALGLVVAAAALITVALACAGPQPATPSPAHAVPSTAASHPAPTVAGVPQLVLQEGHAKRVTDVAFSPDGEQVLTGSDDNTAKLWDVASGKLLCSLEGHTDRVKTVAFSPDGKRAFTGGWQETAKLWDVASGTLLHSLEGHAGSVNSAAFSPDGKRVLTGSDDSTAKLWDAASGKLLHSLEGDAHFVEAVAFSPDGKRILTASDALTARLWDASSGKLLHSLEGHVGRLTDGAFSPDGQRVLTGSLDNTARLWSAETGEQLAVFPAQRQPRALFVPGSAKEVILTAGVGLSFHRLDGSHHLTGTITVRAVPARPSFTATLVTTPDGLFTGDDEAFDKVVYRIGPNILRDDLVSADQLFDYFYRPSLVDDFWAGRPLTLHPDVAAGVGKPPRVEFLELPRVVRQDVVRVRVRATSRGGGVKRIWLFRNGARVPESKSRALTLEPANAASAPPAEGRAGPAYEQVFEVALEPGDNRLRAEAYGELGLVRGVPARATVTRKGGAAAGRPDLYLFAMSLESYVDSNMMLDTPHEDAAAVIEAFRRQQGRLFAKVHVTHLKDGGATLEGVEAALKAVASKARRRDVFVMFAAGHGGMAACEPRSHQERYYLLSYRATLRSRRKMCLEAISMQRLTGLLRPIHSNKKLLVLDTCQSGGAATGATLLAMRGAAEADAIKRLARAEGLAVLAASKPNQAAYEAGPLGHGLFTYALLEGLQGSAAPRGDSTISVFSLVTYVDRRLPALARQYVGDDQQANYSIQGADFPLFSFVPTDPPLVSGATQGSSSKPAPAPDGSPTPPEAVDQAIDQYVRKEAALVLDCVGRDRAVVVATVQAGGTVAFAVQGLAAGSAQARCVERALTLSVGATGGVTRVPLRRE